MKTRAALILGISAVVLLSAFLLWVAWPAQPLQSIDTSRPSPSVSAPRAALLDGLYGRSPNDTFTQALVSSLSNAGFAVDVFQGKNVTIDLLRNVEGYRILILRVHSAVYTDDFLYVFSGEEYTESRYADEQLAGAVRKAYTFNETEAPYFALNSVFMGKNHPGSLNGTTLIMMGCNGTANDYVTQRFLQEGVEAYISWDGYVSLEHSDEATLRLVKAIYLEGLNPAAAVAEVNGQVGADPAYHSRLVCALP
ncbi:MAG: hypothetical protein ACE14S_12685 [Candidatus Bathyarchaeia archaeon]